MYHWKNGIGFERLSDAGVRLHYPQNARGDAATADIPAAEWVSIVHAVARGGVEYSQVEALHSGKEPIVP